MRFLWGMAVAVLVPAVALTFSLVAFGAAKHRVAHTGAKVDVSSAPCFPSNQVTVSNHFGPFSAISSGSGTGKVSDSSPEQTASVTWTAFESVTGNNGTISWSNTPGGMSGSLKADITIAGPTPDVRHFTSYGILEANVEDDGDYDVLMEAEYCGKVAIKSSNLHDKACTKSSPESPTCRNATATLELSGDGTEVSNFRLSIDYGTACNEAEAGELTVHGGGTGSWSNTPKLASGEQRGRVNFPPGYNHNNCPGFD